MTEFASDKLERDWARAGVLFNCPPSEATPDLERLLLETARRCAGNSRLFSLSVSWLSRYSNFVARHRLARLVRDELGPAHQPALGLIIDEAVRLGAPRELRIVSDACRPGRSPVPLFDVHRGHAALEEIAERNASALSRRWGVPAPSAEPRPDALRPARWILEHNPAWRERIVRKGDLRASIIVSLERDVPGGAVRSEAALAERCGVTRAAIRKALHALEQEDVVAVNERPRNRRDHPVRLKRSA